MDDLRKEISDLRVSVDTLTRQLGVLQKSIAWVREELVKESSNTTYHIDQIHEIIKGVHERLYPVLYTVFPNLAAAEDEIEACLKKRPS